MKRHLIFSASIRAALVGIVTTLALCGPSTAQELGLGTDFVSRYVWRGTDFGESASLQPALAFSTRRVEIGTWASYSISSEGADANEHDLWIDFTLIAGSSGSVSVGVTDYYFPSPDGGRLFDFSNNGDGSHVIEPYVSYTGPTSLPITVLGAFSAYNDPDDSVYLEASLPIGVETVDLNVTTGVAVNGSEIYGNTRFAVVNFGLTAGKNVSISSDLEIPISVSYILNPLQERSFLVFGLSVSIS